MGLGTEGMRVEQGGSKRGLILEITQIPAELRVMGLLVHALLGGLWGLSK